MQGGQGANLKIVFPTLNMQSSHYTFICTLWHVLGIICPLWSNLNYKHWLPSSICIIGWSFHGSYSGIQSVGVSVRQNLSWSANCWVWVHCGSNTYWVSLRLVYRLLILPNIQSSSYRYLGLFFFIAMILARRLSVDSLLILTPIRHGIQMPMEEQCNRECEYNSYWYSYIVMCTCRLLTIRVPILCMTYVHSTTDAIFGQIGTWMSQPLYQETTTLLTHGFTWE